jgi:hypothetical protein
VTCRIEVRYERERCVVHLAGRLTEAQVPALLETCGQGTEPPRLELDELVSADVVGIDALLRIEQQGAELVGLPEYLRLKLEFLAREQKH